MGGIRLRPQKKERAGDTTNDRANIRARAPVFNIFAEFVTSLIERAKIAEKCLSLVFFYQSLLASKPKFLNRGQPHFLMTDLSVSKTTVKKG